MSAKTMTLSKHIARDEHPKKLYIFGPICLPLVIFPILLYTKVYPLTALHCNAIYCILLRHAETSETPGSSCPSPITGVFFAQKGFFAHKYFCLKIESR